MEKDYLLAYFGEGIKAFWRGCGQGLFIDEIAVFPPRLHVANIGKKWEKAGNEKYFKSHGEALRWGRVYDHAYGSG